LANSKAAIVCSGTATLETALWNVPQVVVYKTSPFSYAIAKSLVKAKYISLVNLIVGKQIVQELIQSEANVENISAGLKKAIHSSEQADVIIAKLGHSKASVETAKGIIEGLQLVDSAD
jgi:lipid-A-disaccharide synthase